MTRAACLRMSNPTCFYRGLRDAAAEPVAGLLWSEPNCLCTQAISDTMEVTDTARHFKSSSSEECPMVSNQPRDLMLLLVDNNTDQLERWRIAAERAGGFKIVSRKSFEEALDALHNYDVGVLVSDLFLTIASEQS